MEIISREEAKRLGLKRYFTGVPCKNGHVSERSVADKRCCECAHQNRIKHAKSIKQTQANWYQKNREKALEQQKEYASNNKEARRSYHNSWAKANPEKIRKAGRKHEEKRREFRNIERNQRRKYDLGYLVKERYRDRILKAVKHSRTEKAYKTAELLGCTVPEFIEYLKGTMTEDMIWQDFVDGKLHLDHIKPLASFSDLSLPEQQLEAFHYSNYQLLWARDNLSKGAKYKGIDYRKNMRSLE